MMTFEKSGARLKNGQLHADDGSVLSVNGGEFSCPFFSSIRQEILLTIARPRVLDL